MSSRLSAGAEGSLAKLRIMADSSVILGRVLPACRRGPLHHPLTCQDYFRAAATGREERPGRWEELASLAGLLARIPNHPQQCLGMLKLLQRPPPEVFEPCGNRFLRQLR